MSFGTMILVRGTADRVKVQTARHPGSHMNDIPYRITTNKTWSETMYDLEDQMRLWGVTDWETNHPRGARSTGRGEQSEADRTVKLTYNKNDKTVTLVMGKQPRAVDNLRVLYLAVEA